MDTTKNIVAVQFKSRYTDEFQGREYSYFAAHPLAVGDVVEVPAGSGTGLARVSRVNVPFDEVRAFADRLKTIEGLPIQPEAAETEGDNA